MVNQDVIFRLDPTVYKGNDNTIHLDTNAMESKEIPLTFLGLNNSHEKDVNELIITLGRLTFRFLDERKVMKSFIDLRLCRVRRTNGEGLFL